MKFKNFAFFAAAALMGMTSCSHDSKSTTTLSGLDPQNFVAEVNGKPTVLYTLTNDNGMEVCVTNFGGRVVSIMAPDKNGQMQDVVLGFDSIADYIRIPSDFGASIGRYANRIDHGRIIIDGDTTWLPANNVVGPDGKFLHTLHGGPKGWQYQVYDVERVTDNSITLVMDSPDGDNDFPGNVIAKVTYTLTPDNALDIAYEATTDKPTVINMTNHSYFNLSGNPDNNVLDELLMVNSSNITPVDSTLIPTGEFMAVVETPFDFKAEKKVGAEINADNEQLGIANGYDHNWVLDTNGNETEVAATVVDPESGIKLTVYTDEPGIQVYTGNFLDGTVTGKKGKVYNQRSGICLETQHYPDSPNKPEWPSVVLRPGETYKSHCIYAFSVAE